MTTPIQLKTGGDPRLLPDYAALRDELAKLSHPARPDVDWLRVEQLSLALFRQNGVELQTVAWYTLARTRLAAMPGLNEGLALLSALLTRHWGAMWPQPVHARMEILSGFSQRLQAALRTLTLGYGDLPQVYQAEQHLNAIRDVLTRLELKNASQTEALCLFMHNASARLEKMDGSSVDGAPIVLTAAASAPPAGESVPESSPEPMVYVVHQAPAVEESVPARPWRPFAAGAVAMLVLGSAGLWGWQASHPAINPLPVEADTAAMTVLEQQSPDWLQHYGFDLAAKASPQDVSRLKAQWQQHISANALPVASLSGWHQGMEGLQAMTRRLNELDERKGKYLTGSELKSMVFEITRAFSSSVPVEEQLYLLSQTAPGEVLPAAQIAQTDMYLNQLLNRYALIKQQAEKP